MNILITGGSKGIGKATLQELASNPLNSIYFTYNRTKPTFSFPNCHPLQVDFTNSSQLELFIGKVQNLDLDTIINNYHTGYTLRHAHKTSTDDLQNGMSSNIYPTIELTSALIPGFRKKKSGKIITILTQAIENFPSGFVVYTAEKRYLSAFVDAWKSENKAFGISSEALYPGFISTDIHKDLPSFVQPLNNEVDAMAGLIEKINSILYVV
jgi:3-oxoacyl-[acyl-carrier protein] reductase